MKEFVKLTEEGARLHNKAHTLDKGLNISVIIYQDGRKTPCFSRGDIRPCPSART